MKRKIIAVGGGEIGRTITLPNGELFQTDIETMQIDEFIVQAAGKSNPKMLFIGTASQDKASYLEVVCQHFKGRLHCSDVSPLNLINMEIPFEEIQRKIFSSDIIYVGGGDTTTMLKIWKTRGVDKLLYNAYRQGVVLSGISAGAICWFEYYDNMDDIDDINQLDIIPGLGFIKGFGVPHYNQLTANEKDKINAKLIENGINGWSIDDCAAISFENEKLHKIITTRIDRMVTRIP